MDPEKIAHYIRRSRDYLLALAFLVGLLLGWMVIGWWFWPVKWIDTDPWDLRAEYQKLYVSLVAKDYWQTRDVSQMRRALAGWDDATLAEFLAVMETQTSSPDVRERLAALREALALGESDIAIDEIPLLVYLLRQRGVAWGTVLSASPLIAAIILVVSPHVSQVRPRRVVERRSGARQVEERRQAEERPAAAQQAATAEATEEEIRVLEVTPGQIVGDSSPSEGQDGQTEAQPEPSEQFDQGQTETEQNEAQQAEAQQSREGHAEAAQGKAQQTDETREMSPTQERLSEMQERLARLRETMPQMQQPVAQMQEQVGEVLEQLGEAQGAEPQMTLPERRDRTEQAQGHLRHVQEQLEDVDSALPEDAPAETQAEVEQIQQLLDESMAQLQQQTAQMMLQMQQGGAPQSVVEQLGEQEAEGDLDLQDLIGGEDILSGVFEDQAVLDPDLETLAESLEYIDIFDLSDRCKTVADRLRRHNSPRSVSTHAQPERAP